MVINLKFDRDELIDFFEAINKCFESDKKLDFLTASEQYTLVSFLDDVAEICGYKGVSRNDKKAEN